jgi:hypothetical protein
MVTLTEESLAEVAEMSDTSAPRPVEKPAKPAPEMKVVQSDEDLMDETIDISWTKKEVRERQAAEEMEVLREDNDDEIRGITVVRAVSKVEDYESVADLDSSAKSKAPAKTAKGSRPSRGSKKTATKSAQQAKSDRKRQIAENRKKAAETVE